MCDGRCNLYVQMEPIMKTLSFKNFCFTAAVFLFAGSVAMAQPVQPGAGGSSSNPAYVIPGTAPGTLTQTSATCGTSSGTILAASTALSSETFQLPYNAANGVWLNFTGGTATQALPSIYIGPGGSYSVTLTIAGIPSPPAVTCIAATSTAVGELYK